MSARASSERSPTACSGAMYSGVPLTVMSLGQRGGARVLGQLDQPEVEHLGDVGLAAPHRDEHVGGLQVAVDQAQAVRLGQPRADLAEQVDDPPGRQRAGLAHQVGEAQALEVFHHVVERAVVGVAVVVDLDRVGVRQPGGRLHLALEPGQGDRVGTRPRA